MGKFKKILFLCSANVGRSQIAQGYYNHLSKGCFSQSVALVEDRVNLRTVSKIKDTEEINKRITSYGGKPDKSIIQIMKDTGIDISNQRIQKFSKIYLVKTVVLIYQP